jgi:hypothetical protein
MFSPMLKLEYDLPWMSCFMMTADVFCDVEAGARFIDSPYGFPHYNIL